MKDDPSSTSATSNSPATLEDTQLPFGSWLKNHRVSKKISLEEIAAVTKVHISQLKALEENQHEKLPASAFVRGFIVNYARHLGMDEDEALERYKKQLGNVVSIADALVPEKNLLGKSLTHPKVRVVTSPHYKPAATSAPEVEQPPSALASWKLWAGVSAGVATIAIVATLIALGQRSQEPKNGNENLGSEPSSDLAQNNIAEAPASNTNAGGRGAPAAVGAPPPKGLAPQAGAQVAQTQSSTVAATPAPSTPAMKYEVELRSFEDRFVRVQVDDSRARNLILSPKSGQRFAGNRRINLAVSDSLSFEVKWNNQWHTLPGGRGKSLSITLPDDAAMLVPKVAQPRPRVAPVSTPADSSPAASTPASESSVE